MNAHVRVLVPGVIALFGVWLYQSWWNLQPSIKPDDVQLQAVLRPPGKAVNPLPGTEHQWTLEITLDRRTERPLFVGDREWFFQVTPYVEGMPEVVWDFMQGLTRGTTGSVIGGDGFGMGNDGRHTPLVAQALRSKGVDISVSKVDQITAFGYTGDKFPAQIRYYLQGPDPTWHGHKAFVVYSHYEKRWGRDLSWTAVVPAQMDKR